MSRGAARKNSISDSGPSLHTNVRPPSVSSCDQPPRSSARAAGVPRSTSPGSRSISARSRSAVRSRTVRRGVSGRSAVPHPAKVPRRIERRVTLQETGLLIGGAAVYQAALFGQAVDSDLNELENAGMKLGALPQNPIERVVQSLGLSPEPLLETHIAMLLARAVMEGSRLGVYQALADGPLKA